MKYVLTYDHAADWWHLEITDPENEPLTQTGLPLFTFNGRLEACVSWIERFSRVERRVEERKGQS